MGLLGDLLYPDNKEMAEDLNNKYIQLVNNNTLHNTLRDSYSELAESIKRFDALLMAVLCLQYQIVYKEENLDKLPAADTPHRSQSIADRIEVYAGAGMLGFQAVKSINAMRLGVVNLYRNAGIYKAKIGEGFDTFKQSMQNGLDKMRYRANFNRSGNVDLLTEENNANFNQLRGEITEQDMTTLVDDESTSVAVGEGTAEGAESVAPEVSEAVNVSVTGAELGNAAEIATVGSVEGESIGLALGGAICSIIESALLIAVIVSEIIGAVEAGKLNAKLKDAETNMDENLVKQTNSIDSLKAVFKNLLDTGYQTIQEYNDLIKRELDLAPSQQTFFYKFAGYNPTTGFGFDGVQKYGNSLSAIASDQIAILQKQADKDLDFAITGIDAYMKEYAKDTMIVTRIKGILKVYNKDDIDNDVKMYIEELQNELGVDRKRIIYCNNLRKFMNAAADKMRPYHQAINDITQVDGKATQQPIKNPMNTVSPPNPTYDPDPSDFTLP